MSKGGKSIVANFALNAAAPAGEAVPRSLPSARVGAGVVGATQRSLQDIRQERDQLQAIIASGGSLELDAALIDPSPFPDRLPDDGQDDFDAFKTLVSSEGQKVPIQVRTHPTAPGRYQIVYGHRRWRACLNLGIRVKATLIELSDTELVVAQGIENAARQDLSWIERALFASRMDEAGIKARDIKASLAIDDSELARLRLVCRQVPSDLISAIGRAPKVGRPRWVQFASAAAGHPRGLELLRETLASDKVSTLTSDDRFSLAHATLSSGGKKSEPTMELKSSDGLSLGKVAFSKGAVRLSLEKKYTDEFSTFFRSELDPLIERFFSARRE